MYRDVAIQTRRQLAVQMCRNVAVQGGVYLLMPAVQVCSEVGPVSSSASSWAALYHHPTWAPRDARQDG